ncbi:MAG: endoglucanase, partial [Thermoplasmata archaeon]|nr:endoglucanase [Thermoplasmata archaeon]
MQALRSLLLVLCLTASGFIVGTVHATDPGAAASVARTAPPSPLGVLPPGVHIDYAPSSPVEGLPPLDMGQWGAVPVLRERADGGPAGLGFDVLRLTAFHLTADDLTANGATVVPFQDLNAWGDAQMRAAAIPEGTLHGLLSPTPQSGVAPNAAVIQWPISVYYDQALMQAGSQQCQVPPCPTPPPNGPAVADQAWAQTVTFYSEKFSIPINEVHLNKWQSGPSQWPLTTVTTVCDMQTLSQYEMGFAQHGVTMVIYGENTVQGVGTYGIAIGGLSSATLRRGESANYNDGVSSTSGDYCGGTVAVTPRVIPSVFVSGSQGYYWNGATGVQDVDKTGTAYISAHELGHVMGMQHGMAHCWTETLVPWHLHKTLEAYTSATDTRQPDCSTNTDARSHYHWYFNDQAGGANDAINAEWGRLALCLSSNWCTTDATPSAVQGLVATPGNTQVTLSWGAPQSQGSSAVQGYCMFQGTLPTFMSDNPTWCPSGLGTTMTVTGLTNGQPYFFYVRAYNSNPSQPYDRNGPRSNYASATPSTPPCTPNPPGTPSTSSPTTSSLGVAWSASTNCSVQSYKVFRNGAEVPSSSGCYRQASTGCTDSGLAASTTYTYTVSAVSTSAQGGLEGGQSGQGSGTTGTPPCTPSAPGTPSTSGATSSSLGVAWSASSNCATANYKVYRSTSLTGTYAEVSSGGCFRPAGTSCTDGSLAASTTYWYKVSAVSSSAQGSIEGSQSTAGSGTTSAATCTPNAPTSPSATRVGNTRGAISVAWTASTNCSLQGYMVYRSTVSGSDGSAVNVGGCASPVSATSCTDNSGLADNTWYYYRISAVSTNAQGGAEGAKTSTQPSARTNGSPGTPSTPSGPSGTARTTYTYSTSSTDPDGDSLQYIYDWNDGTGTCTAGANGQCSHSWAASGAYCVKAYAQDQITPASSFSNCLSVTMVPANDNFASATNAGSTNSYSATQATTAATLEGSEPSPSCQGSFGASVWYRFSPG